MKAYAYFRHARRSSRWRSPLIGGLILGGISGAFSGFGALPMMGLVIVFHFVQQAWRKAFALVVSSLKSHHARAHAILVSHGSQARLRC
jgi:hypothetical protein